MKKQTSSRVSTKAAKLAAKLRGLPRGTPILWRVHRPGAASVAYRPLCTAGYLLSVCFSAVSQDEVKGQAKPKRRKARVLR